MTKLDGNVNRSEYLRNLINQAYLSSLPPKSKYIQENIEWLKKRDMPWTPEKEAIWRKELDKKYGSSPKQFLPQSGRNNHD